MRLLLLIVLTFCLSALPAWAKSYSCRDKDGQLHFSDNLQGLPEECLGREKVVEPGPVDNLNFVPATEPPEDVDDEFEQSVREVERALQQKQLRAEQLEQRAESLSERYHAASQKKRQALRRWSYRSREEINRADKEIAAVRNEKELLVSELAKAPLPADRQARVTELLAGIEDE